jgi:pimeloyl-ACP methyl ester carboxylesterase
MIGAFFTSKIERAVPPLGTVIDLDGARMHYVDRGSGPPIVMIHGLAGNLRNYTYALVDHLTNDFRVIAIDRPGSGYSARSHRTPASLASRGSSKPSGSNVRSSWATRSAARYRSRSPWIIRLASER